MLITLGYLSILIHTQTPFCRDCRCLPKQEPKRGKRKTRKGKGTAHEQQDMSRRGLGIVEPRSQSARGSVSGLEGKVCQVGKDSRPRGATSSTGMRERSSARRSPVIYVVASLVSGSLVRVVACSICTIILGGRMSGLVFYAQTFVPKGRVSISSCCLITSRGIVPSNTTKHPVGTSISDRTLVTDPR